VGVVSYVRVEAMLAIFCLQDTRIYEMYYCCYPRVRQRWCCDTRPGGVIEWTEAGAFSNASTSEVAILG
jgi:hypothetical protein